MPDILFEEASFSSALLDTVGALIVVLDIEGRILSFNRTCELLTGYTQDEVRGTSIVRFLLGDEIPGVVLTLEHLSSGEQRVFHQNHWVTKTGELKLIEWSNMALKGKDGKVQYILGTGIDVTERNKKEKALRESEQKILKMKEELEQRVIERTAALERQIHESVILQQKLNDLLLINPVVIVSCQPAEPYIITYISENIETIFGYRPDQMVGIPFRWRQIVHPDDLENAPRVMRALELSKSVSNEFQLRRADGQYRNVHQVASLIRDIDGNPVEIHFSLQDITAQREYEHEIREREEMYRSLAESARDFISVIAKNGTIAYVNRFGAKMFGLLPEDMIGKHRQDFFSSYQAIDQNEIMRNVFTEDQTQYYDELVTLPEGLYWFGTQMMPIHGKNGEVNAVLEISRDITARKQVENELKNALQKEKEFNELQVNFISMITHQFGTPLSTILSSAEMLAEYGEHWTGDRRAKHHQRIISSAQRINAMMQDILELGRADATVDRLNIQPVDLVNLCMSVVDSFQLADQGRHQFEFDGPDQPIVCLVDEHLIYYSLENLLTNAMKYSPSGSLIGLSLWVEGGRIHIRVKDQGMGISPQDLNLVGKVFYRGKNATRIPGTGLGLAFVKRSMEAMQGTFTIRSQEKIGTEVDLQLVYRPATLEDTNSGGDA